MTARVRRAYNFFLARLVRRLLVAAALWLLVVISALLLTRCYVKSPPIHFGAEEQTAGVTQATDGAVIPDYSRADWGGWLDVDGDCQDTRQEVLIAESLVPVVFEDERQCRVSLGQWRDPYTDQVFTNPSDLDIDHVVALKEAYDAGGWEWDSERKKAYANNLDNPDHLIAVSASANRSKGSRGPEAWLPPKESFRCEYLKIRQKIYETNQLDYDCGLYLHLMVQYCQ